jgi:hypothetical protein
MGKETTVKVDKALVKKAHEVGLNVSKVCENALQRAIEALEDTSERPSPRKKDCPETNIEREDNNNKRCGCGLVWSMTQPCQGCNAGSNPASRTTPQ